MKKQIFIATISYTLLGVLQPLSNLILLPVYTSNFTIQEYATFSILNNLSSFFTILSGLSIIHAIMAFYTSYKGDAKVLNKYIANVLSFTLYFSAPILLLSFIFGNAIFKVIFKSPINFYPAGLLCVFYGLITNVSTGYLFFLKYEKKSNIYAVISAALFIINTFLQYYFINILKTGVNGAWSARCITAILSVVIVFCFHFRYLSFRLNFKKYILPSLRFSIPLIPASFLGWITTYGDRFIIERFVNLRSLGIYSILLTLSSLIEMIYLALGAALQPFIFDFYLEKNLKKTALLYGIFITITVCFGSGLLLLGSNLDLLIKKEVYLEATPYLSVMIIGYFFASISYLFNLQVIYIQKSKYFVYQSMLILPINIMCNIILIPVLDIWGAVLATVITKIVMSLSSIYYAEKYFSVKPGWKFLSPVLFFIVLALFFLTICLMGYITFKIASIIQFIIVLTGVSALNYSKIQTILSLVLKKYRQV
ncbi:MAG: lipopolysaccharide biosynthesis protein [Mucilaginibacter sp.]